MVEVDTILSLLTPDILQENALILTGDLTFEGAAPHKRGDRVTEYATFQFLLINYTFDANNNLFRSKDAGMENFGYITNPETGPDSGTIYIPCPDIKAYLAEQSGGAAQ